MSLPRLFQQARREASLEHYRRVGILDELGADVTLEENKKLERRLTAMMKKLKAQNEDDVEARERYNSGNLKGFRSGRGV